jgi:hypothetical protein
MEYHLYTTLFLLCFVKYSLCFKIFVVINFFSATLTIRLIQKLRKYNLFCLRYVLMLYVF